MRQFFPLFHNHYLLYVRPGVLIEHMLYLAKYPPHSFSILLKCHLKHGIKARRGDTTQDATEEENIEIWEDLAGKVFLAEIGTHVVGSPSKSSLWRKSHRKPRTGNH